MELYFVTILSCLLHVMEHSCSVKLIDSYNVTKIKEIMFYKIYFVTILITCNRYYVPWNQYIVICNRYYVPWNQYIVICNRYYVLWNQYIVTCNRNHVPWNWYIIEIMQIVFHGILYCYTLFPCLLHVTDIIIHSDLFDIIGIRNSVP